MDDRPVYAKVVGISPPKLDGELVLLAFQVGSGEFVNLALSTDIATHLGTYLLLVAGQQSSPKRTTVSTTTTQPA